MEINRLRHTLAMCLIRNNKKRLDYLRKNKVYAEIGENVSFQNRKVPLYPSLIKLHNNIRLGSGVTFVTHDCICLMLRNLEMLDSDRKNIKEKIGCIEVEDNVYIGNKCTILYNTRIGPNAIVAAGSLVNRDVPPNSVVAGVPAKVIGTFDDFVGKRKMESGNLLSVISSKEKIDEETTTKAWELFYKQR